MAGDFSAASSRYSRWLQPSVYIAIAENLDIRPIPVVFFSITAFLAFSKHFGAPYIAWIGYLPAFKFIDFLKYEEAVLACSVAVLAAIGVDRMMRRQLTSFEILTSVAFLLFFFILEAVVENASYLSAGVHSNYYINAFLGSLLAFAGCVIVVVLAMRSVVPAAAAGALIAGMIAIELNAGYIVPMFYVVTNPASQSLSAVAQNTPYVKYLEAHAGNERIYAEDSLLYPNWSSAFQLEDVRLLDALYDRRYLPFIQTFFKTHRDEEPDSRFTGRVQTNLTSPLEQQFLRLSSVRYVAVNHAIGDSLSARLYATNEALGRPPVREGYFDIGGVSRSGLSMHPSQPELEATVHVPRDASGIVFSIASLPFARRAPVCGDRVAFNAKVWNGNVSRSITRSIDPRYAGTQRRWIDERIDVAPFRGGVAQLSLGTRAEPSRLTCNDRAVFADLRFDDHHAETLGPFASRFENPAASVYEFKDPLPRLAAFSRVDIAGSESAALARLGGSSFDARSQAIVESSDPRITALESTKPTPAVAGTIESYQPTMVTASIDLARPSLVVLNDTWYPGWEARVDGTKTPIEHANYLFRGVFVPAGIHRLTFEYRSETFRFGSLVTFLGLILLCILLLDPAALARSIRRKSLR